MSVFRRLLPLRLGWPNLLAVLIWLGHLAAASRAGVWWPRSAADILGALTGLCALELLLQGLRAPLARRPTGARRRHPAGALPRQRAVVVPAAGTHPFRLRPARAERRRNGLLRVVAGHLQPHRLERPAHRPRGRRGADRARTALAGPLGEPRGAAGGDQGLRGHRALRGARALAPAGRRRLHALCPQHRQLLHPELSRGPAPAAGDLPACHRRPRGARARPGRPRPRRRAGDAGVLRRQHGRAPDPGRPRGDPGVQRLRPRGGVRRALLQQLHPDLQGAVRDALFGDPEHPRQGVRALRRTQLPLAAGAAAPFRLPHRLPAGLQGRQLRQHPGLSDAKRLRRRAVGLRVHGPGRQGERLGLGPPGRRLLPAQPGAPGRDPPRLRRPPALRRARDDQQPHALHVTPRGTPGTVPGRDGPLERFENSIHFADRSFGTLLEEIRRRPRLQAGLLLVTGDHSSPTGEHGYFNNEVHADEEFFRIPLALRWPGHLEPRRVADAPFSQMDIAPTIIDLLRLPVSRHPFEGVSLFDERRRLHPIYLVQPYAGRFLAVVEYPWKIIRHFDRDALYNLESDPGERVDLAGRPELAPVLARLRARLQEMYAHQRLLEADALWPR